MKNYSVKKCCICNNEKIGEFITYNDKKYHLCCIEQLQNNWNELKKWIKEYKEALENQTDTIEGLDLFEEHTFVILDDVSVIMQELENNND